MNSLAKHNDHEMPPAKKQKQWELTIEDIKVVETGDTGTSPFLDSK